MADAITLQEFKERNTRFNRQISALEEQRVAMCQQEQRQKETEVDPKTLEKALCEELDFTNGIQSEVVATILDHIVVLEQSDDQQIYLEIYLRLGQQASAHFQRGGLVSCNSPLKSTTPRRETRTISFPSAPLASSRAFLPLNQIRMCAWLPMPPGALKMRSSCTSGPRSGCRGRSPCPTRWRRAGTAPCPLWM